MRIGLFYPGCWVPGGTERHVLGIASAISREEVVEVLTFSPTRWDDLGRMLNLDLSRVKFRTIPEASVDALAGYTEQYDLWINGSSWHIVPSRNPNSVLLVVYPPPFPSSIVYRARRRVGLSLRALLKRSKLEPLIPTLSPRLGRRLRLLSAIEPCRALATYRFLVANSVFTSRVIRRRWHRESVVLYPPIDTTSFEPLPKRPFILSVGRFGSGGNNKKHLALVKTFQNLVRGGLRGWELHLAGSTHHEPRDQIYFDGVKRACLGYPIVIHADSAYQELRNLYGQSTIYWHGAGYGEDDVRNPLAVEHFGITTVEAMAAGCIPIVCGKGGQPEIVSHDVNGFLWNTLAQLQHHTIHVIDNPGLAAGLRAKAIQRSRQFSMDQFSDRLREIFSGLSSPSLAFR